MVIAAVAAFAILSWLVLHRRERPAPPLAPPPTAVPTPVQFVADRVEVAPGSAGVLVGRLYTAPVVEGTWWEFVAVCHQLEGCRGEYEFTVDLRSGGSAKRVVHRRTLDLPSLGQRKVAWLEPGRYAVETVERVTITLLSPPPDPAVTPRAAY